MINVCIKSIDLGNGEIRYPTERFFYVGHDIKNHPPLAIDEILALDDDHAQEFMKTSSGVLEITTQDATRTYSRKAANGAAQAANGVDQETHDQRIADIVEAMNQVDDIPQNLTRQGYPNLKSVRTVMGGDVDVSEYRSALAAYRRG